MPLAKTKSRVGEKRKANCGMEMEIVGYHTRKDIDVLFENGTVAEHKSYPDFCKGSISPPGASHIGEKQIAKNGMEMTLVAYRNAKDIDILFSDGTLARNRSYYSFLHGRVLYQKKRIGERKEANCGISMRITAYRNATDLDVEFLDGTVVEHCSYSCFLNGKVAHPMVQRLSESDFHGVKVQKSYEGEDGVYYICTFPDGEKDICTLQEVMEKVGVAKVF